VPLVPAPTFTEVVAALRTRLTGPLPGEAAMLTMAPSGRGFVTEQQALASGAGRAAALALLYPTRTDGEALVALTTRSPGLRNHGGQVSLPGGRMEPGEDVVAAALREAHEELAVPTEAVDVLGTLTPIYIAPSDFVVYPVVAAASRRPDFRPDRREVAAVLEAPMASFVGASARRTEWRFAGGVRRYVPYFLAGDEHVWGATAMILAELAALWPPIPGDLRSEGG
jgi:8-oxo-dGTP pyrophosphatase MutT (NUDIX family)